MGLLEDIMIAAVRGEPSPKIPDWIEWVHISQGKSHCATCLRLDKCWFADRQIPALPQHPFCHCRTEKLPLSKVLNDATSASAYSKFDPYLFNTHGEYPHGKEKLFESWGYTVEDAPWLQQEFERQALEKYIAGEYALGKLDDKGQRISIEIKLPRKDYADTVTFISGWMVWQNGKIQLTTPYGGK